MHAIFYNINNFRNICAIFLITNYVGIVTFFYLFNFVKIFINTKSIACQLLKNISANTILLVIINVLL